MGGKVRESLIRSILMGISLACVLCGLYLAPNGIVIAMMVTDAIIIGMVTWPKKRQEVKDVEINILCPRCREEILQLDQKGYYRCYRKGCRFTTDPKLVTGD